MKTNSEKSGRISVKNRQAIKATVPAFARVNNMNANEVMSAVLWVGERAKGRMSASMLVGLVNMDTITVYRNEIGRRNQYFAGQIAGIVRNSLPRALRTENNRNQIFAKVVSALQKARLSLSAIRRLVTAEVAALQLFVPA